MEIGGQVCRETELGKLAPHDLRRTCAKLCRKAGGDLEQIQLLLGHASLVSDAHVSAARPTVNFGSLANLYVGGGNAALLQFDLTGLPSGTTSAEIAPATLTVFVNRVNASGAVSVAPATSAGTEGGVTYATQPSAGAVFASFTPLQAGQYMTLDVTPLVQAWLANPASNDGLVLNSSTADVLLDSKENDQTGHPAHLDITVTSTGLTGATGATGAAGLPGTQGVQGLPGVASLPGATGAQGLQGLQGVQGTTGAQGVVGATGVQEIAEANGVTGCHGHAGTQGATGMQGTIGTQGATGASGGYLIESCPLNVSGAAGVTVSCSSSVKTASNAGDTFYVQVTESDAANGLTSSTA